MAEDINFKTALFPLIAILLVIFPWHTASSEPTTSGQTKKILQITDKGLKQSTIEINRTEGSLFFLNSTTSSQLTIDIDFGDKRGHCWSRNLAFKDERLYSTAPLGPDEFSVMCFPQPGSYPFKVFGLKGRTDPLNGVINSVSQ